MMFELATAISNVASDWVYEACGDVALVDGLLI